MEKFDPIQLEVLWNRLISITQEQAAALIRSSFTTVVREAEDISAGVFDTRGNMVAQAITGTPGHINSMANAVRFFLERYPLESLRPGDTLISNDPWLTSGHLNDITVVTPTFKGDRPVGLFANICHAMDIGGRTMGADAREVFEEGLYIPVMKLCNKGEFDQTLIRLIRANVRVPDLVMGDITAQVSANEVGSEKLSECMDEYGLDTIEPLSDAIIDRSEEAMRDAISEIPNGTYRDEIRMDGFDEDIIVKVAIAVEDRDITVDYTGTSQESERGINVVFNYCQAYTTYPLKCAVNPEVPNNEGSFRPVTVHAPEGCILNALWPAPVSGRHILGHFLYGAIFGALSKVIPERVTAEGSSNLWNTQFDGYDQNGQKFAYIYFSSGGTGARPTSDGISAAAFPSGVLGVPAEVIENVSPLFMKRRELIPGSGGPGKFRGGLGQKMVISIRSDRPAVHSCMYDRIKNPARGFRGGSPGRPGSFYLSDGTYPHPKRRYVLEPGIEVHLDLPGGGGFYVPSERDAEMVLKDVINGLVSVKSAKENYKVWIDEKAMTLDYQKTEQLRSK